MKTTDFIRSAMTTSMHFVTTLLDDMKDAPLTQPTQNGGNHPLWVVGHLAYSEANLVNHMILGNTNPLIEWKPIFGDGSEPVTNVDHYPKYEDVLAKFADVRKHTLSVLDGMSDEDLDKPNKNCPPGREGFLGTIGQCFAVVTLHPAMHFGQVADARRADGRKPLVA